MMRTSRRIVLNNCTIIACTLFIARVFQSDDDQIAEKATICIRKNKNDGVIAKCLFTVAVAYCYLQ